MATHSSVLAWRIPGTGKPGGLPSLGSHRDGHDRSDLAAAAYKSVFFKRRFFRFFSFLSFWFFFLTDFLETSVNISKLTHRAGRGRPQLLALFVTSYMPRDYFFASLNLSSFMCKVK